MRAKDVSAGDVEGVTYRRVMLRAPSLRRACVIGPITKIVEGRRLLLLSFGAKLGRYWEVSDTVRGKTRFYG